MEPRRPSITTTNRTEPPVLSADGESRTIDHRRTAVSVTGPPQAASRCRSGRYRMLIVPVIGLALGLLAALAITAPAYAGQSNVQSPPDLAIAHQVLVLPVSPGNLSLALTRNNPTHLLDGSNCDNGNREVCGTLPPVVITDGTGATTGWTITEQVTNATCRAMCAKPDLYWISSSAIASNIVPGTTSAVITGPVSSWSPTTPQVICSTNYGQSNGTFVCGASLQIPSFGEASKNLHRTYLTTMTVTLIT
jgi:hypothetical protein